MCRKFVRDTEGITNLACSGASDIDLVCIVEPEVPDVLITDASFVLRSLLNLFSNAFRAVGRGSVDLRVALIDTDSSSNNEKQPAPKLRFTVTDTGPGVNPAEVDQLFAPFVSGAGSTGK